ncbi:hypothetical protein [Glaciibacter psychrotolerans]|uniref:Di-and tripeptidase n=1 Tax=Glaciibacter psychrotolerans TaxID=670054 RepID=A0A7Z0EDK1_9MICO|nr:hypothetical protein [Leifsonia psychrotolerans]NYJ19653.1 hypothetical protein [Leifsonia psychrotolerans]
MARKPKPLVSPTGGPAEGGQLPSGIIKGFDRMLAIHRPSVLAHIRAIRRRNPTASPAELVRILERRYLAAVTTGGAAVGATAVIPGVTTGITLVLSGVETAGFLEATTLYAQSVSEVHGIAVEDPERARALVLTMMLGREGSDLVRQLGGQVTGAGTARTAYWGELVTSSIPRTIMVPLTDKLKSAFIRQFASRGGASFIGKAAPFGIGAVIGGAGNHILGKRVVQSSRLAFGPAPAFFRAELEPIVRDVKVRTVRVREVGVREAATMRLTRLGTSARSVLRRPPSAQPSSEED